MSDKPNLPEKVTEAFHLMWGNFPEPVTLVHKSFCVMALNKAFEVMPSLRDLYKEGLDAPAFEVFYLDEAKVAFYRFATYGTEPEIHRF